MWAVAADTCWLLLLLLLGWSAAELAPAVQLWVAEGLLLLLKPCIPCI
jgi:hypothetical protein